MPETTPHTTKALKQLYRETPKPISFRAWARAVAGNGAPPYRAIAQQWLHRKGLWT